jgi:branched-subunit amino acid transport protein
MRELAILAVIGLGTYAMRAAFLVTARADPPPRLARLLPHVGPAVLAAITLPALLAPRGEVSLTESLPSVLAALVAWALWRRTASLPVALFGGLALWWLALWALTAL